jgi:lysophospholipase L1-like esterase
MSRSVLLAIVLSLFPTLSQAQLTDPRPDLMVSAGDSITAAFIANTQASHPENEVSTADLRPPLSQMPNPPDLEALYREIDSGIEPSSREYYDEAQDRMLRASNLLEHKGSLSWATGGSIRSHYSRLARWMEKDRRPLGYVNVAHSGARAKDLEQQADEILSTWDSDRYRSIAYITLLIGANDACSEVFPGGTPADEMAVALRKFIAKLATIDQRDRIRVLVAGMPRIPDLGFEPFRHHALGRRMTCAAIQHLTRFCPALVDWTDPMQYWNNLAVVLKKNAILEHIVQEASRQYPNLDIRYTGALFNADIAVKHLAKDCFHPNALGQSEIADKLWAAQPWFK